MKAKMILIISCFLIFWFNDFALAKPAEQSAFKEAKVVLAQDELARVEKNRAINCPSETGQAGKKCITVYSITEMMFNMAEGNSQLRLLEMLSPQDREKEVYQQKTAIENGLPWGKKAGKDQYVLWEVFSKVVLGQAPDNFLYFPFDREYLTRLASADAGRIDAPPANASPAPAPPPLPKPVATNADGLNVLQEKISALQAEIARANRGHLVDKAKIATLEKQLSTLATQVGDLIKGQTELAGNQTKLTEALTELTKALDSMRKELDALTLMEERTDDKLASMADAIEWNLLVIIISFSTVAVLIIVFVVWTRQGNKKRTQEATADAIDAIKKVEVLTTEVKSIKEEVEILPPGLNIVNIDEMSPRAVELMQPNDPIGAEIVITNLASGEKNNYFVTFTKLPDGKIRVDGIKRDPKVQTITYDVAGNSDLIKLIRLAYKQGNRIIGLDPKAS